MTEHGNGPMGRPLSSPTGCLVSPTEDRGRTTRSWTALIPLPASGTICTTATTMITFASSPYD